MTIESFALPKVRSSDRMQDWSNHAKERKKAITHENHTLIQNSGNNLDSLQ